MTILGIDPGTSSIGYALLEDGGKIRLIEAGLLLVGRGGGPEKLKKIHREMDRLIARSGPDRIAVEKLFFYKNQKTALGVAEARGVILLTAVEAGIKVYEYAPLEVKYAVSGDGRADKLQIKKMVGFLVPETKNLRAQDDVLDAAAVALTCFLKNP